MFFDNRKDDLTREIDEYYNTHNFEHSTHSMEQEIAEAEGREYVDHSKHSMRKEISESEKKKKTHNEGYSFQRTPQSTKSYTGNSVHARKVLTICRVVLFITLCLTAVAFAFISQIVRTTPEPESTYVWDDEEYTSIEISFDDFAHEIADVDTDDYYIEDARSFMSYYTVNRSMQNIDEYRDGWSGIVLYSGRYYGITQVYLMYDIDNSDAAHAVENAVCELHEYMKECGTDYEVYIYVNYFEDDGDILTSEFELYSYDNYELEPNQVYTIIMNGNL